MLPKLAEWHVYGNEQQGRFLTKYPEELTPSYYGTEVTDDIKDDKFKRQLGKKAYELKDHLGNVRTTFSDIKIPTGSTAQPFEVDLLSKSEYYPYGMVIDELSYNLSNNRYGFGGTHEMDNEVKGGVGKHLSFGDFGYDTRVARRFNNDPIDQIFISNYAAFANNPINITDPTGYKPTGPDPNTPNVDGSSVYEAKVKSVRGIGYEAWVETEKVYSGGKAVTKEAYREKITVLVKSLGKDDFEKNLSQFSDNKSDYYNEVYDEVGTQIYGRDLLPKGRPDLDRNPFFKGNGLEIPMVDPIDFLAGGFVGKAIAKTTSKILVLRSSAKVATETAAKMEKIRQLGRAGEDAVGITDPKTMIIVNGRKRFPDALTAESLIEVKNTQTLYFTRQIKDFLQHSQDNNLEFILYTKPGAKLSKPLQNLIDNGKITNKVIPFR